MSNKIRFEDKVKIVGHPKIEDGLQGIFGSFIHDDLGDSQLVKVYLDDETYIETKLRYVQLMGGK